MSKKVLILSTSLRKGSNSNILAEAFAKGAKEAGHQVTLLSLEDKQIGYCYGCLVCQKISKCAIKDDVNDILDEMLGSEIIVYATPIYFYEMSGQMKTMIDRSNPAFIQDYQFRDVYLLATAADEEDRAMDGAIKGLEGWIECFPKAQLAGVIKGTGMDAPNSMKNNEVLLAKTYGMGKSINNLI